MTTTEHLEKIKAKCTELLAIAEKRTAGRWSEDNCATVCLTTGRRIIDDFENDDDATFIAACAGPAEAGWRATIAAIDAMDEFEDCAADRLAEIITAAWPEELL